MLMIYLAAGSLKRDTRLLPWVQQTSGEDETVQICLRNIALHLSSRMTRSYKSMIVQNASSVEPLHLRLCGVMLMFELTAAGMDSEKGSLIVTNALRE